MELLDGRTDELSRDKPIVLVCLHGKQAVMAGRYLAYKGFSDLYLLDGGFIKGWLQAGLPVAR
jgi:rhodanese-related sulfurtransferase